MDFLLTDDQDAICALAERLFADHLPDDARLTVYGAAAPFDAASWVSLVAAGLTGLAVPEAAGGSGLGMMELAQVLEAQGAVCAPVPLLVQSLAVLGLRAFAPDHNLLAAIAGGDQIVSFGLPTYRFGKAQMPVLDGGVLTGHADAIAYGMCADHVLLFAETGKTAALVLVPLAQASVARDAATLMSGEQAARLTFDGAACKELARGDDVVAFMRDRAFALQAAVTVGVLDEALKRTAAYVGERQQFGRPIGGFQAVSQQMADAFMAVEALRTVMWKALSRLDDDSAAAPAAAGATKYWVSEAAHKVAHTCLHLHGGIGQDLDYPIQRYFLWAKFHGTYLGTGGDHLSAIGALAAKGGLLKDYQALAPGAAPQL